MPVERRDGDIWCLRLSGHLTATGLGAEFAELDRSLDRGEVCRRLLVDATAMTNYEAAARDLFVKWHREHRDQLTHVAVITEKTLWRVVVGGMALASGQNMRAFPTTADALGWIGGRAKAAKNADRPD